MNSQLRMAINYLGHYDIQWMDDVPFIWLELPYGWRSGEFVQAAEGIGILLKSAEEFGLRQSTTVHAVRIALDGTLSMAEFEAAIRRLVELLDNPPEKITV
jgi:DNA-binding transcriptional MocR family regulator